MTSTNINRGDTFEEVRKRDPLFDNEVIKVSTKICFACETRTIYISTYVLGGGSRTGSLYSLRGPVHTASSCNH